MGWSGTARKAAAEEYGRQNWRRLAARRSAATGVLTGVAVVFVAGRWLMGVWRPGWTAGLLLTGVAVVMLVVLRVGWAHRRPYRMPSRRFRSRY
jgi:uncharacterized membrane protein YcjF (UPF0283 family)